MNPSNPPESLTGGDDTVLVRRADSEDAASIAAIYNHYVDAGGATFDTIHWKAGQIADSLAGVSADGWYVALIGGQVVGWASARPYSQRHGYRFTCETAIYLATGAIGTGAADRLQRQIEQHCQQWQIHHAVAKIVAENHRSIAFHRKHGYEMVGIQKEIGHMHGHWIDVAILQRLF